MRFGEDITYCVKGCDGCYRSAKEAGEGIHTYADLTNDGECPKNRYIRVYDIPCDEYEVEQLTAREIAERWIPCRERMPDKSGEYLITIKWEDGSEIYFSWFYLRDRCWSYRNANVVAWMELPEPYREDKE